MKTKFMTASDIKGYIISLIVATLVLYGIGYHPTIDALLMTTVWIYLILSIIAMAIITVIVLTITNDTKRNKNLAPLIKAIDVLQNPTRRMIGLIMCAFWLYALVIQEWTITAVVYFILVCYSQLLIFMTKDFAKDFFVKQLKGEE